MVTRRNQGSSRRSGERFGGFDHLDPSPLSGGTEGLTPKPLENVKFCEVSS